MLDDGFITDAEWIEDRLRHARKKAAGLQIALDAAPQGSARWHDANVQLGFAREEIRAYEQYIRDIATASR